ncbi:MAG TPA: sigma factor-like helix-turn-helix DNA-binding protein, partial [Terrimesophilobacter sp.]|nr:sigma factor-like helix-turn-helix DNA-binding protein [Terrimesophilobacter sp.]
GFSSALEYLEDVFGYAPRTANDRLRVAKALAELPAVDRRLVSLTTVEGFTLQEASEVLGLSYGATKTRSSRVRRRLHNALTSSGIRTEGTTP